MMLRQLEANICYYLRSDEVCVVISPTDGEMRIPWLMADRLSW